VACCDLKQLNSRGFASPLIAHQLFLLLGGTRRSLSFIAWWGIKTTPDLSLRIRTILVVQPMAVRGTKVEPKHVSAVPLFKRHGLKGLFVLQCV
jgi:hypothetical protein